MSVVDEIKQRLDAVELINTYVPLKKAGANYKGLCPFHAEKTPSFVVFPDSGTWHCFGACSTGGDIFSFIMRRENMDFADALRFLAQRAGVELEPLSTGAREHAEHLTRLRQLNAMAATYFQRVLADAPEGAPGRDYMQRRQVSPQSLSDFQIGYAPNGWHHLEQHLHSLGVSQAEALEAGLLSSNEAGSVYDRFRGRVMFPICDIEGHVIGFGGRVLDDSQPKYLNTPQTPLFDKGSVLYGIDRARSSIRASGIAIVVEGYMDVVIPHQYGATNVIACMGTALTESHIDILKRMTKTLILALDSDAAGIHAIERGALAATEALPREVVPVPNARGLIQYEEHLGAEIRVLMLPEGMDPDELILSDRERWDTLIEGALPVTDFYFQQARNDIDVSSARGKQEAAERMLPLIATLDSPVQRAHYIQRLAQWIRVDERQLAPQLDRLRSPSSQRGPRARRSTAASPAAFPSRAAALGTRTDYDLSLEEHCLALLLEDPAACADVILTEHITEETFTDTRHREIFRQVMPYVLDPPAEFQVEAVRNRLDSESAAQVESLTQRFHSGPPLSPEMLREDMVKCSTRLRKQELSRSIDELRFVQQDAQDQGLSELGRQLSVQIAQLTGEFLQIERRFQAATYLGRRQSQLSTNQQ